MDKSSTWDTATPDLKQNGHRGSCRRSDVAHGPDRGMGGSDLEHRAAAHTSAQTEAHCGATSPQQQERSPAVSASEDSSPDVLRIVKHQPSAIVFCDHDRSPDNQGSSDGGESSSPDTAEGEGDNDEDDDFPETLQYKEFLVSRRRRSSSRNRKCSRKRQEAQPGSTASGGQKPAGQGKAEVTGGREEEENNGGQVRKNKSRGVVRKNKDNKVPMCRVDREGKSVAACQRTTD